MRFLLFGAMLALVQPVQEEADIPRAPEFFAELPRGVSEPVGWTGIRVAETYTFERIPHWLVNGNGLTAFLVREGVCAPDVEQCAVMMRYGLFVRKDERTGKTDRIVRFVLQGPGGTVAEGVGKDGVLPGGNSMPLIVWLRKDDRWQSLLAFNGGEGMTRYDRAAAMVGYIWRRGMAYAEREQDKQP
ncbi:MAG TPA: hypothetical protein VD862_00810 [Candidatus Paceibacterota bacterium]|nr:hypothetical protein [Candidatus Paceibacterota bacterium]